MDMGDVETEERRVQARFVTKLKPPSRVPNTAIAIPANLTRLGLSTIVNTLLKSGNPAWESQPFDFLIDGELIRMSLDQVLLSKGFSAEKTLEIEYIKAVVPRKVEQPSLHNDWVSAVNGGCPQFILTGCYDSFGRVWKHGGVCTHVLEGHGEAITSISIINPEGVNSITIASASKDQTLRLWKIDAEDPVNYPAKITAFKILRGHVASVRSVAAQASGSMVFPRIFIPVDSNFYKTNDSNREGDLVPVKRRKVKNEVKESQLEGEAMSTLVGHTQCVSSVVWPEHGTIYSASWDHSIRRWDIDTGKDLSNIFCAKAVNCLHVGGQGSPLIAAGGSDPILRVWDPRKPGTSAPIYQFPSHNSWISSCKWHNASWFHLLSSSYDRKVMLWDLRTAWPLAIIDSHEDKVLCADWWKGDNVISGGVDSKLCVTSEISVQ